MSEFVLKPKDEEQKLEAKVPDVQFDALEDEIEGAERAEGKDRVAKALLEVKVGAAQPEALLEWIDDLRDPEEQEHEVDDDKVDRGFASEFIPDTARDAATENPPSDDFVFFSANRRSGGGDDDEGDLGGGGGGGGSDGSGDGDGEGEGGDEGAGDPKDPKDPKDSKKAPGTPAKAKPAKSETKQPPKAEPPPPGKGGGGKKPDGK